MNQQRRKHLQKMADKISALNETLSGIKFEADELAQELRQVIDCEQDDYDNLSERQQSGERGSKIESAIAQMEEAFRLLEYVYDLEDLDSAVEALAQAQE